MLKFEAKIAKSKNSTAVKIFYFKGCLGVFYKKALL